MTGNALRPEKKTSGWLVKFLDDATDLYTRYATVWWATGLFHKKVENPTQTERPLTGPSGDTLRPSEVKSSTATQTSEVQLKGTFRVLQNNFRHDIALCIASGVPIFCYFALLLPTWAPPHPIKAIAIGFCAWWCFDRFVSAFKAVAFGFFNKRNGAEHMTLEQAQRRIILKLVLYFPSLIFAYAVVYWGLEKAGCSYEHRMETIDHALQLSFSTMTTIGYGTYAPTDTCSILVAMVQSATAILNLGASLSALTAMLKVRADAKGKDDTRQTGEASDEGNQNAAREQGEPVSEREYKLRLFTPWLGFVFQIGILTLQFWYLLPSNSDSRDLSKTLRTSPILEYRIVTGTNLPDLQNSLNYAASNHWEVAFPVNAFETSGVLMQRRQRTD